MVGILPHIEQELINLMKLPHLSPIKIIVEYACELSKELLEKLPDDKRRLYESSPVEFAKLVLAESM